jgi:hypothetical protein
MLMGIGIHIVESLIREHCYRPVKGDVVMIGRQTVYFSPEEIMQLLAGHGIDTSAIEPESIEIDSDTIDRLTGYKEKTLITDRALFRLLGVPKIRVLDRSDYEGAEIIHDLCQPLPASLRGTADFIVDGSTLDNTFNPALTLRNYCELLKPGGRFLGLNAYSCFGTPYCIMPPMWYLDYFVMNNFADCKAYVLVFQGAGPQWNSYWLDLNWLQSERRRMGRFVSNEQMCSVIFAEKGSNSTSDCYPVQQDYRSDEDWEVYSRNLAVMQRSRRPHLLRSNSPVFVADVLGGHMLIDTEFNPVPPIMKKIEMPV